jgi:hypothetical protein
MLRVECGQFTLISCFISLKSNGTFIWTMSAYIMICY